MLRYMSTHPTLTFQDKDYLQKKLKYLFIKLFKFLNK